MKKAAALLLVLMLGTSITNGQSGIDPVKEVQNALTQKMKFPDKLKRAEFNEGVQVKMKLNPDGKVNVLEVASNDIALREYVESAINEIALPENLVQHTLTLSVNILFKVL